MDFWISSFLLNQIWIWNWWYSFELLCNFRFSFGTAGYCIDKSFLNLLTLLIACVEMLSLVYDQQNKSAPFTTMSSNLHNHVIKTCTSSNLLPCHRRDWVRRNCLRTGVRGFCSCLYKRGMPSSAACECGAEEQTVEHVDSNVHSIDLRMDCVCPDGSVQRD